MNIIEAIQDEKLFRPFLGSKLSSWSGWMTALRAVYGLEIENDQQPIVRKCTGRSLKHLPDDGFQTSIFLTGRRSGKSRTAAIIGAYEAAIAGHERKLSKGERGIVAVCAPSKSQSRIVKDYLRSIFEGPSILANEVVAETREGFELCSGNRIEILSGDWRTIRGYTLLAAIVDEACFFGYDSEAKIRSDSELIRAISPGLSSIGGKLICISSPYATRGYCYNQFKKHFGKNHAPVLIWNCPSRVMNPSLPQSVIDRAMEEDPLAARSEYMGEFRDDVAEFISAALVESLIVKGRQQLIYSSDYRYYAFVDLSGGRSDDAALAIAHFEGDSIVLDVAERFKAPFNPNEVIESMAYRLKKYQVRAVMGDNYAANFVSKGFRSLGIRYRSCKQPKNELYAAVLPWLCSHRITLLDSPLIVSQFSNLERRTRSGGRDVIDHRRGAHDDVANAIAGVVHLMTVKEIRPTVAC